MLFRNKRSRRPCNFTRPAGSGAADGEEKTSIIFGPQSCVIVTRPYTALYTLQQNGSNYNARGRCADIITRVRHNITRTLRVLQLPFLPKIISRTSVRSHAALRVYKTRGHNGRRRRKKKKKNPMNMCEKNGCVCVCV